MIFRSMSLSAIWNFIKKEDKSIMNCSVVILVISMLVLVFFVVEWVRVDRRCNQEFKDAVLAKLDSLKSLPLWIPTTIWR